jgi:hypothetical protein
MLKRLSPVPFMLLAVLAFAPAVMALDLDPQELVGLWSGPFEVLTTATRGDVKFTITEVTGDQLTGVLYYSTSQRAEGFNRDIPVRGTLSGNTITIVGKETNMTLTILDKTSMKGEVRRRYTTVMSLNKEKK